MSEMRTFLKSIHVENFRSLRKVDLPLKPLTVLVGPNASGKSNALRALSVLKRLMTDEKPPTVSEIQNLLWAGGASHINFQFRTQVGETPTVYKLNLKAENDNPFAIEELLVGGVKVISIRNGEGVVVQDENGDNKTSYNGPNKLALWSAGDYGKKPITNALTKFMKSWAFFDFTAYNIRQDFEKSRDSTPFSDILSSWHENEPARFDSVSETIEAATNFRLAQQDNRLYLLEGYKNPIPLENASDGTLRLVAYKIYLNVFESWSLITIEEPEHNLHPGALTEIAKILRQTAERSQVIITTHSPQLLDAFSSESLSNSVGILFLRNLPGRGTEVRDLEDLRKDRTASERLDRGFRDWQCYFRERAPTGPDGGGISMSSVRIWAVKSDHDYKMVKRLADKAANRFTTWKSVRPNSRQKGILEAQRKR